MSVRYAGQLLSITGAGIHDSGRRRKRTTKDVTDAVVEAIQSSNV
jgi:hypothetical protein